MRIKRSEILDILIWLLFGFYTLIAHWIWFGRGIQETALLVLFAIQVIRRRSSVRINSSIISRILLAITGIYSIVVTLIGNDRTYLVADLKSILLSLFSLLYLYTFYKRKPEKCLAYIHKTCNCLMIYMWINSLIILLQWKIPYFLMNRSAINSVGNLTYHDQLTGFIGINGTTRWNILSCIIILYLLLNTNNGKDIAKTIIFIAISLLISMINSARAFLIMMPLFVLFYYVVIKRKSIKIILKYIGYVILVLTAVFVLYRSNNFIREFIDDLFYDKVRIYTTGDLAKMARANDDRAVAINYAINQGGLYGKGIGSIPMHYSNVIVKYMGLNSASSFIYMIGIVGYFLYTFTLGNLSSMIINKKSFLISLGLSALWLIISFLLPVYSSAILMMGTGLIIILYAKQS